MKILLDENIDERLPEFLTGHEAKHVAAMGWRGSTNGELLSKAQEAGFQVFITADKNMPYQQSMKGRPFPLLLLDIHPNVLANQIACIELIERQILTAEGGGIYVVEGPYPNRSSFRSFRHFG